MEEEPIRIKACLTRESEKEFVQLRVDKEDDFRRLAKRIDSPVFECSETGDTFTIDPQKKIKYILKKE